MNHRSKAVHLRGLIAAALAVVLSGPILAAQATQPPPTELMIQKKPDARLSTSLENLRGEVDYAMLEKSIEITWFYRATDGEPLTSTQFLSVSFWPTEVAGVGDDRLLVAGKDCTTGAHFVEEWLFATPRAMPGPLTDPETGVVVNPRVQVATKKRTKIFTETEGRGPIRVLMRRHGTEDACFVQFWGQRDLFSLDLSDVALTKVLTILPDGSLPQLPELAEVVDSRWSRKHETEGYVYYMGKTANGTGLFLFDNVGLDGVLDELSLLDLDTYRARGLDDGSKYLEYH